MTSKEYVKSIYPDTVLIKTVSNNGSINFIVKKVGQTIYLGIGSTRSKAWSDAKQLLKRRNND